MSSDSSRENSPSLKKKQTKNRDRSREKTRNKQKRTDSKSPNRSDHERKKKNKEKHKKRNKSPSRSRDRERKKHKDKQKYRQKDDKQKKVSEKIDKPKQQIHIQKKQQNVVDSLASKKPQMSEEELKILHAKRRVKALLLKFNGIDSDSSDQESKKLKSNSQTPAPPSQNSAPPQAPNIPQQTNNSTQNSAAPKKRESKWGKSSTANDSGMMVRHEQPSLQKPTIEQKAKLDIEPKEDSLKISEDKSIDVEEPNVSNSMVDENQEEIDPLDQYMNEIQPEAALQMDLPKKGQKGKTISFEDIVRQDIKSNQVFEQVKQEEQQVFRKKFMDAITNIEQVKSAQDKKGTLMQNNEERQSDFSDFHEEEKDQLDFFAKQRKMAERKQLGAIDHSKIQYEDVRFNLYREAEEVRDMDPKQVLRYRKEAGDIKIRGKGILNPILNWYHCGLSDSILNSIQKNNYQKPFAIQAQAMPMIFSGRDVIGIAETGSGKTIAYLLPMLKHICDQRRVQQGEGPIGIIMIPTRQLANQVYLQAKKFTKNAGIRVIAVYGGKQIQKQLSDLKKGAEIIICTPGRMIDILTLNKGKITNLKRVTMLVIDEADRMFDLGFEPQITRILDNVRPNRQTILFSATFPKNVQNLAKRILTNPVEIVVGSRGQACRNVEQIVQVRQQTTKFLRILQILGIWHEKGSVLIFIDKQTQADFLYQQLLKYGYDSLVLHGAMDATDRECTIYDFKKGIKTIMIATSVCARGLDIKQIVLVVNFKCPNHPEDYVHRIGRTGRAGNKGTAITFITSAEQQYSTYLIRALKNAQSPVPEELIKMNEEYERKVKKGEARKIRNRNLNGQGFKFNKDEEAIHSQLKDMFKKQLKSEGLGGFDDSDDDDIQKKKKKQEQIRGGNSQDKILQAIKNPQIKNKLLNEAVKAVTEAFNKGQVTASKILQIAVNSMKESITKHKVITTVDDGVEQVTNLINSFTNKGDGNDIDFFSYDFEINDYPASARQKACSNHFLNQIQQQNNCKISLRGVYVEPGKKAPLGTRKLYLHIQSVDKSYVSTAYKDIKRVIEEGAYQNMHMSAMGKYSL